MNRGFSLFQGEVAMHHLKNDHSAFWEVRKEGSFPASYRAVEAVRHSQKAHPQTFYIHAVWFHPLNLVPSSELSLVILDMDAIYNRLAIKC